MQFKARANEVSLEFDDVNPFQIKHAPLEELLVHGPVGDLRYWAGNLTARMLETFGISHRMEDRLRGTSNAALALDSLLAAAAVMTVLERGLFMLAVMLTPWQELRNCVGLTLKLYDIIEALAEEVGRPLCVLAAASVLEHGPDAVCRYPIAGLFPEIRRPGEGTVIRFTPEQCKKLGLTKRTIEADRLVLAVDAAKHHNWETNLRPLTAWWMANADRVEVDAAIERLLTLSPRSSKCTETYYRWLGLLDWLIVNPEHPRVDTAMRTAMEAPYAPLRKCALNLAAIIERWDVIKSLAVSDPDKKVRQFALATLFEKGAWKIPPPDSAT